MRLSGVLLFTPYYPTAESRVDARRRGARSGAYTTVREHPSDEGNDADALLSAVGRSLPHLPAAEDDILRRRQLLESHRAPGVDPRR